jgi:hypothetical protein
MPAARANKPTATTPQTVTAEPTKRFFVQMLVRDIELVPAIVDLVDNSVDGAHQSHSVPSNGASRDGKPLEGFWVSIDLDAEKFIIEDNCGGIPIEHAIDYAFRFGRPDTVEPVQGEVGQFGVGMKRALFKLGRWFSVGSTTRDGQFSVDVDVEDWLDQKGKWRFPIVIAGGRARRRNVGTKIAVKRLFPSVAGEFAEDRFVQRLRDQIEFRHSTALEEGLVVKLNAQPLSGRAPTLLLGEHLRPRVLHETLEANGDKVEMDLFAGFVDLKDEDADTDDPDEFQGGNLAGWYLVCNGRMLLFADRTRLTGWGQEVADYHPQYRRFRGYVFLNGNSAAMPWNTAKTTVDEDNAVWRQVRIRIVEALRDARTVMNRIKSEVQDNDPSARPVTAALDVSAPTRLAELPGSEAIDVPPKPPKQPSSTTGITYTVATEDFDRVVKVLGVGGKAEVGRRTFYYYVEREVDD